MPELLTLQDLANGHLDVKALGEAANGDENTIVTTRTGSTYPSAERAIKTLFENGGLPATPFATKALMTASALGDGKYAMVTEDAVNNGLYVKTSGSWVKSDYDPVGVSVNESTKELNLLSFVDKSKNLYDKSKKRQDVFLNNRSEIISTAGWSVSDFIPVIEGETYTISAETTVSRRVGTAFFADKSDIGINGTYERATGVVTRTAPVGAKYLVVNIDSNTATASKVQVENGGVATSYEPFYEQRLVKKTSMPNDVVYVEGLADAVKKDYEINVASKNLFDANNILVNRFLTSSTGGVSGSTGWGCSGFIPVIAGETYTLSGVRSRAGLSYFATTELGVDAIEYISSTEMPLTTTAPVGANFAVFNIYQPTKTSYSNLQFEKGAVATNYVEYGDYKGVDSKYIVNEAVSTANSVGQLQILADSNIKLTTKNDIDLRLDLIATRPQSHDISNVFNFWSDSIDGVAVRNPTDDVSPLRADNATVGANHGYFRTLITSTAHGKTNADVGSVWSDGTAEWVIIDIISANVLAVTARNSNATLTVNSLTHVSGATNTTAVNTTTKVQKQWYPAIKNRKLKTLIDGRKIDTTVLKTYEYNDNVAFHESYEIMSKSDIVEWIITNKGQAHATYNAAPSILCNFSYVFDKDGGCTIYASITAYKSIPFQDWMVTQSTIMTTPNVTYYVPKTIPFTQSSIAYDFTKPQSIVAPTASNLNFDAAKNEVGANPVDRLIQLSGNVGYAIGYLPVLDAAPEKRLINASSKYIQVRNSSLKVYPSLLDSDKTTLEAGDNYAAIAYRKYFKNSATRLAKYVVRSKLADFLYLDWQTSLTDIVELDDDLIGRDFTVHEKSSNVTLLSAFATNNIAVKIDNSKSYGYLVLRFDK